jgi:predicted nucleic acid-binding protein
MSVRSFFDTNVLIYADDADQPEKRSVAATLLNTHRRDRTGVLSIQVLQEYFVVATRKLRIEATAARRKVELFSEFDVVVPEVDDVLTAIDLHRLHGFSFWDALLVRAAKRSGCRVLLTEDLQHLRDVDGVRIVNPFRPSQT